MRAMKPFSTDSIDVMQIDLIDWVPSKFDRRLPIAIGVILILGAALLTPLASIHIQTSYPITVAVMSASFLAFAVTAMLLGMQTHFTKSRSLMFLSIAYAFDGVASLAYLIVFPIAVEAQKIAPSGRFNQLSWLWLIWHSATPIGILAYRFLGLRPEQRWSNQRIVVAAALFAIALIAVVVYSPLPTMVSGGHLTAFTLLIWLPFVMLINVAAFLALATKRPHRILDAWLGLSCILELLDVYLNEVGTAQYTVGWYGSRLFVLLTALTLLGVLLAQVVTIYHNLANTADRYELDSKTDPLTGLLNRRGFEAATTHLFAAARRRGAPLSVALIDIDRFKSYNDAYGHVAGDGALKTVADIIAQDVARFGDCVGRYGGEEFILLFSDTNAPGARNVVERIRQGVEAAAIEHRTAERGRVTISAGLAQLSGSETLEALTQRADAALYVAKAAGRNRSETAPDLVAHA